MESTKVLGFPMKKGRSEADGSPLFAKDGRSLPKLFQIPLRDVRALIKSAIKRVIKNLLPNGYFVINEWRRIHGVFPRFIWPRTFNEKVLNRILFDRRPLLTLFADKLAVRSYVEERLGAQILPTLYHVTADPNTIPFDSLPDKFVVKPTHGCSWVKIVTDKSSLNRDALIHTCRDWLAQSYYETTFEWAYKNVKPRIVVEEFVDEGSGCVPNDYKFFVFDGTVALIQVDAGRFRDHRRRLFTPTWLEMDAQFGDSQNIIGDLPRPKNLESMIDAAESLARGIDFVRVDFYDIGERIYFGELTMTPGCGYNRFRPPNLDDHFGNLWNLRR